MNHGPLGGGGSFYQDLFGGGNTMSGARNRVRRDVMADVKEEVHHVEEEVKHLEKEAEDLVAPAADKVGMEPW